MRACFIYEIKWRETGEIEEEKERVCEREGVAEVMSTLDRGNTRTYGRSNNTKEEKETRIERKDKELL